MKSMRATERLIAVTVLVALSCALSGCGTNGSFDPTDMLDFLDTKKKMPGERKPVFPNGVPGVDQGVPKELYKGAQQQDQLPPSVAAAPAPAPEPKSKKGGTKSASRTPPSGAAPADVPESAPGAPGTSVTPVDEAPSTEDGTAAAAPQPAPKRTAKRRSITAPPPDAPPAPQAQSQAHPATASAPQTQSSGDPFPAPLPSGGFQR
jgi:hypothetical protein